MSKKRNGKFSKGNAVDGRKKLKAAICIGSVLLIVAVAALIYLMMTNGDLPFVSETTVPTESTQTTTQPTVSTTMEANPQVTTQANETTSPSETTQIEETTEPEETTKPKDSSNNSGGSKAPAQPPATQPAKAVISLPYVIPGTSLQIERIASYDGIYLEDGSDADVTGVAMMLLTNVGSDAVEYAKITMKYDDKVLTFEASALPAGGVVAVQEAGRNSCASGDLVECSAEVAVLEKLDLAADQVSVVDNGDNSLTVTNLTDQEIVTVRIFYKYYMGDEDAYVGGITFTAKISNLKANESIVVTPSHYASGASEVVMVRTYDTDA